MEKYSTPDQSLHENCVRLVSENTVHNPDYIKNGIVSYSYLNFDVPIHIARGSEQLTCTSALLYIYCHVFDLEQGIVDPHLYTINLYKSSTEARRQLYTTNNDLGFFNYNTQRNSLEYMIYDEEIGDYYIASENIMKSTLQQFIEGFEINKSLNQISSLPIDPNTL